MTNLQTVRSQLLLYKTQHLENLPASAAGEDGDDFAAQMTQYTDVDGAVSALPDSDFPFGPYLQTIPVNPVSGDNTVTVVQDGATAFAAPAADGGWWFNSASGQFRANLTDARTATDGTTKLNEL
jgi:hypothetical protein